MSTKLWLFRISTDTTQTTYFPNDLFMEIASLKSLQIPNYQLNPDGAQYKAKHHNIKKLLFNTNI